MARNALCSFLLALAAANILAGSAAATLVLYEPFADATANGGTSYATGATVAPFNAAGQNNGPLVGANGGAKWYGAGPTGTTNTVSATGLSVPGLAASSGGSMQYGVSTGPSARVNLNQAYSSGTIYFSFALKVQDLGSLGTSGGFVVAFNNAQNAQSTTPTVLGTALMIRSVGSAATGNFNLGVRKQTGTPSWSSTVFSITDPNPIFLVGSYTFNTGNTSDDVAKMWLNPSSSTFGGLTPADELVHTAGNDIAAPGVSSLVFFRRGNANLSLQPADMLSDEIRVGTTWADVTPAAVPEASSFAALCLVGGAVFAYRKFLK